LGAKTLASGVVLERFTFIKGINRATVSKAFLSFAFIVRHGKNLLKSPDSNVLRGVPAEQKEGFLTN
jgi:hypothetical protein